MLSAFFGGEEYGVRDLFSTTPFFERGDRMTSLVAWVLRPSTWVLPVALAAAWALGSGKVGPGRARRWAGALLIGAYLLASPAASHLALGSLEWWYPPSRDRPEACQAIVVLGGYLRPADAVHPWPELGHDSIARCRLAAELYDSGERCPVFVCGGIVAEPSETTIAAEMAGFLADLGVDPDDIRLEDRSRSTYENAVFVSAMLADASIDSVLLVTDAMHLPRSVFCFRHQGIETVPRGSRYRATSFGFDWASFLPTTTAMAGWDEASHEWLGIGWYWLRGRFGRPIRERLGVALR